MTKKRAYCKNTVQGSQRGRKYPPKLRAEVVMAMVASNNVCAVARRRVFVGAGASAGSPDEAVAALRVARRRVVVGAFSRCSGI